MPGDIRRWSSSPASASREGAFQVCRRQNTLLSNGVWTERSRYKTYAWENFKKSKPYAKNCPMKQAVIAPSMMYLLYPLNGTVEGYPKEKFVEDLVKEVGISVPGFGGLLLTRLPCSARKTFVVVLRRVHNVCPSTLLRVITRSSSVRFLECADE